MYRLIILILVSITLSCDDFPKDPSNTLKDARNNILHVGVAESNKWASVNNGNYSGIEVDLIKEYAKSINAEINWVPGSQIQLIDLLNEDAIDIAIGGFTKKSPFEKHAGFTRPHHVEEIRIGAPAGKIIPDDIEDKEVWVEPGSEALVAVKKKKGKPVLIDSLSLPIELVAAPTSELRKYNLNLSDYTLTKVEHVFVIQKGENAFLESLERFIDKYEQEKK